MFSMYSEAAILSCLNGPAALISDIVLSLERCKKSQHAVSSIQHPDQGQFLSLTIFQKICFAAQRRDYNLQSSATIWCLNPTKLSGIGSQTCIHDFIQTWSGSHFNCSTSPVSPTQYVLTLQISILKGHAWSKIKIRVIWRDVWIGFLRNPISSRQCNPHA